MIESRLMRLAPLALALPVGAAQADTLLGERLIDVAVTDDQGPPYVASFRTLVGEGGLSLFTVELDEATSPGTIYTFASNADAPNYDFITGLYTDGVDQLLQFLIFRPLAESLPVNIEESEQDFFSLADVDFAGETITKVEFEVFEFDVQAGRSPGVAVENWDIEFSGAIRVFGEGNDIGTPTVIPTPTAAALGLLGLVGLSLRSRSPYPG